MNVLQEAAQLNSQSKFKVQFMGNFSFKIMADIFTMQFLLKWRVLVELEWMEKLTNLQRSLALPMDTLCQPVGLNTERS